MANTAQPNQPLSSHPLPLPLKRLLGAGSTMLPDVEFGTDYLVVPPPPASPNGDVARLVDASTHVTIINNTASPIPNLPDPDINFALVYKTATQETLLDIRGDGLSNGETAVLTPRAPLLLDPTDRGIFLRRAVDVVDVPSIQAFAHYYDVRDVVRSQLTLSTNLQIVVSGAQGKTRFLAPAGAEAEGSVVAICNFDNADHNIDWYLSDGVNTFRFYTVFVDANNGQNASVEMGFDPSITPYLLEGWSLSARLQSPPGGDVVLITGHTDTNLSPVRSNQGGAY